MLKDILEEDGIFVVAKSQDLPTINLISKIFLCESLIKYLFIRKMIQMNDERIRVIFHCFYSNKMIKQTFLFNLINKIKIQST